MTGPSITKEMIRQIEWLYEDAGKQLETKFEEQESGSYCLGRYEALREILEDVIGIDFPSHDAEPSPQDYAVSPTHSRPRNIDK